MDLLVLRQQKLMRFGSPLLCFIYFQSIFMLAKKPNLGCLPPPYSLFLLFFYMTNRREDIAPTLPNELLRSIFLECVSSNSTDFPFSRPSNSAAPLNLSWVDSQWRQVALSTPQLWTSIALPNARASSTNTNPNPTTGDIEMLKLYISRSGEVLPLSIALDYGGVRNDLSSPRRIDGSEDTDLKEHLNGMHRLTLIMDGVRHRWQTIVVRCRAIEALSILLSSLVLGTPLLENLLLSTMPLVSNRTESGQIHGGRILDLVQCPQLKNVVLQCPQLILNPFQPDDGQLTNLASLTIHACSSQPDALTWLQSCPNLETISIHFMDAPPFALPHARSLTLPRLTRLTLVCLTSSVEESSDPRSILTLLRLPVLRTLELYMGGLPLLDQEWPHIVGLLQRSGPEADLVPPLEELELLGTPMSVSEFIQLLLLAPGLKKLTIDDELTADVVFRQLSPPDVNSRTSSNLERTRTPLCPELETLVLHACSASLPVLANMATSRSYRTPGRQDQTVQHDTTNEDVVSKETEDQNDGNEGRYQTLKTLELVHSYRSLPPIADDPLFSKCQEYGLKIVQRPRPVARVFSAVSS